MKFILQIFTGSWNSAGNRAEEIIEKIDQIASRIDVEKVIIGWNTDVSVYKKIGAFLRSLGTEMLLWLPVFSEISDVSEPDQAQDVFGKTIAVPSQHDGETFRFVCPSSSRNAQIVKDIYNRHFSECGFDGVFLDRIRSQSFAAGVSGVLSCACARCRTAFLKKDVNISQVRKLYEDRKDAFFDIASWPANGQFILADTLAQRFFEAKEEIIADAVTEVIRYFKRKNLIVGLDLFAPVISRFVGQNYSLITENADFIKPMLYRRTEAPAGIGYEFALFEKHVPDARGRINISVDKAFLHTQLQAIADIPCRKYPGIEINYDEKLVKTNPEYIIESLTAINEHGFDGASLCWNIMQAPRRNIDAAASCFHCGKVSV